VCADIRKRREGAAGDRYWTNRKRAEAIKADRVVRSWFPNGFDHSALPDHVRVQLAAILIEPPPNTSDVREAKAVVAEYSHKELVKGLYDSLPNKGPADLHAYGSLLASYSVQSGFVHGGPDGHDVLVGNNWSTCLDATVDIAITWVRSP